MIMKNLCLIYGDEELKKTQKRKDLLSLLGTEGGPDHNFFGGKDIDLKEVSSLSFTVPFFSERRSLWLDDTGFFKGTGEQKEFLDFLQNIPDTCVVIFTEQNADKSNPGLKYIREHGDVFEFRTAESLKNWQDAKEAKGNIREWAAAYVKQEGASMEKRALDELLSLAGFDMWNLKTELDKLIAYSGGKITSDHVYAAASRTVTDKVFDMADLKLSGNTSAALALFEDMLSIRVEPLKVLYLLNRQFNQVYMIKDMEANRLSDAQILSHLNIKDWQLRKLRERSRGISASQMLSMVRLCTETEFKVKSGDMTPQMAVEFILCC